MHKYLIKKYSWYRKWHTKWYAGLLHTVVFVLIAGYNIYLALQLQQLINSTH